MAAAEHKEKARECRFQDGADPTFPLNRAAAYLKLNKNEDAERDCTTVLKLQSNNVKALFRRAQARVALEKLQDARADLVAAAKAEPGNAAVRTEFTKVEGLIAEATKKAKAGKGTPISLPTRAPASSEPSGSSYRRRVPIAIVNDDTSEEITKETAKPKATPTTPLKSILKNTTPSPSDQQPTSPVVPKSDSFLTPVSTRSLSASESLSQKDSVPVSAPSTTPSTQPSSTSPAKPATPISATPTAPAPGPEPTIPTPQTNQSSEEPSPAFPIQPDSTPPTLLGFLQRWSNTRTDADKASVLFTVPAASIPSLFGPTLESPLFGAMLGALSWALASAPNLPATNIPQRTLDYMTALARVPRFSTLVLFLDVAEKRFAKDIWDGLERSGVEVGAGEKKKWGC